VVCIDEVDGAVAAPDASLQGLFMQIEHTLHTASGMRSILPLPPIQVELGPTP
jgi:hypothetical protein